MFTALFKKLEYGEYVPALFFTLLDMIPMLLLFGIVKSVLKIITYEVSDVIIMFTIAMINIFIIYAFFDRSPK